MPVQDTLSAQPDFGDEVAHLAGAPGGPRELYCRLLDADENVHYHECAFRFATQALGHPEVAAWADAAVADVDTDGGTEAGAGLVERLLARARAELAAIAPGGHAPSWPVRVAREFAPLGLTDGVWLRGLVQFHMVESRQGMASLAQLMLHFGGPGVGESHAQRYATLLSDLGIVPASIGRWASAGEASCLDISYEHALLAPCVALFPALLAPETLGLNLWMAAIGPCPLLMALDAPLRRQGSTAYIERYDSAAIARLARLAVAAFLEDEGDDAAVRRRIASGFAAAQRGYRRWARAMLGANVPMTARDAVLEIIAAKARFAVGHHGRVRLGAGGEAALDGLFAEGRTGHERLLDALAGSPLIRPGDPDASAFLKRSIAFGGPMYDVFSPREQDCLRDWIAALARAPVADAPAGAIALEGCYVAAQDPDSLRNHAWERHAAMAPGELLYRLLNADRFPTVRVFGRLLAQHALDALARALEDPRLEAAQPPPYSEQVLAELVARNHARNVAARAAAGSIAAGAGAAGAADAAVHATHGGASLIHGSATAEGRHHPLPGAPLDGCWLGGFADVHRIGFEEYGWLFRIYAGELGDGHLERNHNHILRRMHIENGMRPEDALLSLRDRRLYDLVEVTLAETIMIALSLNTRHFLPELLGMNLFIEAKGVGGYYLNAEQDAIRAGKRWTALSMRLHNAIDNYASGHTDWSVAAIQAYMARLQDAGPAVRAAQWQRIWRLWRFNEIRDYGTPGQQRVLEELLGAVATQSFVPSELS